MTVAAVHLGLQKTASTMVQRAISRNRPALAAVAAEYRRLVPIEDRDHPRHLPALTSFLRSMSHCTSSTATEADGLAEIDALFAAHPGHVLLSDENLLGPLHPRPDLRLYENGPQVVRWLAANLPADDLTFVLYVRRQDTFLESAYVQHIQNGGAMSFEDYATRRGPGAMDWYALAMALEHEVGRARLQVVPYETIAAGPLPFTNDFLRRCGVPLSFDATDLPPDDANRSYSATAIEIARRTNELLNDSERAQLRRFLQDNFSNVTHPRPMLLSGAERAEFMVRYEDTNRELARRYFDPEFRFVYEPS